MRKYTFTIEVCRCGDTPALTLFTCEFKESSKERAEAFAQEQWNNWKYYPYGTPVSWTGLIEIL